MTGYGPYVRGKYNYIGPYTYDISKGQHEQYFFEEGLNNKGVMKKVDGNWQLNVVYSKQLKSQNKVHCTQALKASTVRYVMYLVISQTVKNLASLVGCGGRIEQTP